MANQDTNTTTPEHPRTRKDSEQLAVLFSEIASEANLLEEMLLRHSEHTDSNSFNATLTVTQKIGYLADKGTDRCGGTILVKGGAEEWFIPPSYHWATPSESQSE